VAREQQRHHPSTSKTGSDYRWPKDCVEIRLALFYTSDIDEALRSKTGT